MVVVNFFSINNKVNVESRDEHIGCKYYWKNAVEKTLKKKIKKKFTKCWLLKKKLYLCTRKKVRKNNFANEIVKGPDKLNVRGFCTVSN